MRFYEFIVVMIIGCLIGIFISMRNPEKTKLGFLSFFLLLGLLVVPIVDYCSYNEILTKQEDEFNEKIKEATERIEGDQNNLYDLQKLEDLEYPEDK
jgi:hypothetical protein